MSTLEQIADKIIEEQERVMGPLAWVEASKVPGLEVNAAERAVTIKGGDPMETIDKLVAQYERLFGRASREVCREAVAGMLADLPSAQIPSSLAA
jgi:hypothetical protein